MIKYSQKLIETSDVLKLIDAEILNVKVSITFQEKLNEQVLSHLKTFMSSNTFSCDAKNIETISIYLENTSEILKKATANLNSYQQLLDKLTSIKDSIHDLKEVEYTFVKSFFDEYDKLNEEVSEKSSEVTSQMQTFINSCMQEEISKDIKKEMDLSKEEKTLEKNTNEDTSDLSVEIKNEPKDEILEINSEEETSLEKPFVEDVKIKQTENQDITVENEISSEPQNVANSDEVISSENNNPSTEESEDSPKEENLQNIEDDTKEENISNNPDEDLEIKENTLIISEKNKNVILPYTLEDLKNTLEQNPSKYNSISDIIEKEYTKPIKYYKNSSVARFKETFKLVREKSHGSLKHAWDMSLEAFFNYDLHPAIISACKNVDELDIYLSCLEYDELEDFKFFKIIFDIVPTIIKRKNSLV